MMRQLLMVVMAAAIFATSGCATRTPGMTGIMGDGGQDAAFAAATAVMAKHYSIALADPDTGVITSRPKSVNIGGERLLGGSPAREVATITLRRQKNQVMATVAVDVQREGAAADRRLGGAYSDSYSSVPHDTPAEHEAATTAEQNDMWRTVDRNKAAERKMLDELYRVLNPD